MPGQSNMHEDFEAGEDLSENDAFGVGEETAGQRLDRFLADHLGDMSRTHVQTLIDEGRVLVNGLAKKPSYRLEAGRNGYGGNPCSAVARRGSGKYSARYFV